MITSDIQEINIADLNEYQGDCTLLLTENQKGYWRKLKLEPNKSVTGISYPFSYEYDEINSTTNVDGSYNNRVSHESEYIDTFYDFSSGIPTWGLQTSDSTTFRWSPQVVGNEGSEPAITCDLKGNAFLIFKNISGDILVRRYNGDSKLWETQVTLDNTSTEPKIEMGESGIAIASWTKNTGNSRVIAASYYDVATQTWSSPTVLSVSPAIYDLESHASINDTGNGVVTWTSPDSGGFNSNIQVANFNVTTKSWVTLPGNLSPGEIGVSYFDSRVGIDNSGNVIAIWTQSKNTSLSNIQSVTYDSATSTWSTTIFDLSNLEENASSPDLSVNNNGDAMAIWIDRNSSSGGHVLKGRKYDGNTKTWSSITHSIASVNNYTYQPKISMNNLGTAIVIWENNDFKIESSIYDPIEDSWSNPILISTVKLPSGFHKPDLSMNDFGDAVATWLDANSSSQTIMESSTYIGVAKKWSEIDIISTSEVYSYSSNQVVLKGNRAVTIWVINNGVDPTQIVGAPGIINPNIMTANDSKVSFAFRKVQEVGEPELDTDAATKFYVDNAIAGLNQLFMKTLKN